MDSRWFVWDLSLAGTPQSQNYLDSGRPPFPALLVLRLSVGYGQFFFFQSDIA